MKQLRDGTNVRARGYYFLLDWNDQDGKVYINKTFNKNSQFELDIFEYKKLFDHATKEDSEEM